MVDAVGDGDGVEFHRRPASLANALFQGLGQFAQMHVAGADLGPGICNPNNGLVQFFFAEPDAAQIRTRGSAARSFGQRNALSLAFDGHSLSSFASC